MWSKMKIRVISALIGVVFVLGIIFSVPIVFQIAIGAVCLFTLYELHVTFKQEKKWQLVLLSYLFALAVLALPMLVIFIRQSLLVNLLIFLLIAYLMLLFLCSVFWNQSIKFSNVAITFFMLIYGVLFPMYLTYIRAMEHGVALIFLPLLGAWMPDTFAYFAGTLFGRHKLIPSISPNKTVEGAVGAVVGGVLMFFVYGLVVSHLFGYGVHYLPLLVLGLLCSVAAQFGDLSASVIKRECQTKDFGNLIPGHGGLLDRIDSLLFVAPLVYYFLQVFEVIYK
ncbi:MAG: phosphatidate cytidylyltransferase [Ruminococcaceae bacterium]|nr:phosphatidate cytidylyltransferase [Oscillospiraceae bacterium]